MPADSAGDGKLCAVVLGWFGVRRGEVEARVRGRHVVLAAQ